MFWQSDLNAHPRYNPLFWCFCSCCAPVAVVQPVPQDAGQKLPRCVSTLDVLFAVADSSSHARRALTNSRGPDSQSSLPSSTAAAGRGLGLALAWLWPGLTLLVSYHPHRALPSFTPSSLLFLPPSFFPNPFARRRGGALGPVIARHLLPLQIWRESRAFFLSSLCLAFFPRCIITPAPSPPFQLSPRSSPNPQPSPLALD